jgi:hypothetical protein
LELNPERVDDGGYRAKMIDPGMPVFARVLGRGRSAQVIERHYGPLYLPGFEPAAAEPLPESAESIAEPSTEEVAESAPDEGDPVDTLSMVLFVSGNVLWLGAAGAYWWWRRRRAADEVQLVDDEPGEPRESADENRAATRAEGKESRAA